MWWRHGSLVVAGRIGAIVWSPFAVFLALGLVCSRRGARTGRAAIIILVRAVATLVIWLTFSAALFSPAFMTVLPPGRDHAAMDRLLLSACPALLLLIIPAALHLRGPSRSATSGGSVTRWSQ